MAPTYSITFINNSTQTGHICVYPSLEPNEARYGLAWLTQPVNPGTRATFAWPLEPCFFWNQSNTQPGQAVSASQALPIEGNNNQVTLSKVNGAYIFGTPQAAPQPGIVAIICDHSVQPNEVSVGLGMAQTGIITRLGAPNMTCVFEPFLPGTSYGLAFGQFETGQPLSEADLSLSTTITFPANTYALTVALNLDHTWSVVPS